MNRKIQGMTRGDLINMFIMKGWSLESAGVLADAMKEGVIQRV